MPVRLSLRRRTGGSMATRIMMAVWRGSRPIRRRRGHACSCRSLPQRTRRSTGDSLGDRPSRYLHRFRGKLFGRWAETRWKRRGTEYDGLKQALTDRLRADLEKHVPETRGRVDYAEVSTPLSTRHFANYQQGEIYGLSAAPARFRMRSLGARTPVRNLYLTGSDACTSGVAGAMFGGVIAASAILKRNLVSKVGRRAA
jgi:hypothetical protein